MFDIGFWELIFIFGLGLLILGPERLPRVARNVGQWVAQARSVARRFQREIEREVAIADVQRRYEAKIEDEPEPAPPDSSHSTTPPPDKNDPPAR